MPTGLDQGAPVAPRTVRGIFPPAAWSSQPLGWQSVLVDAFEAIPAGEVSTPPLDHHVVVVQLGPALRMGQQRGGRADERVLARGGTLVVSRGGPATWTFDRPLDVLHVFVPQWLVEHAALECGCRGGEIEIADSFQVDAPALGTMGLLLLEELKQGVRPGQSLLVDSLANAMAVRLLRDHGVFPAREETAKALDQARLRRVVAYIQAHLAEPLDLESLARVAAVSRFRFSRMFKLAVGESPHRHVVALRLERAARLLSSTPLRLADVAAACGFADQAHMTRLFRARYGATPGAYRASLEARLSGQA